MGRIIELSPRQAFEIRVSDDRDEKGKSVSTLVRTKDAVTMHCVLAVGYDWPFCKLQFVLGKAGKGIDLSQFDTITFDMRYSGRAPNRVRVHLVNFESEFSKIGDWNSQRFNEAVLDLTKDSTLTIPVDVLRTADWWVSMRNVPLAKTRARLDNVTALEVSTVSAAVGEQVAIEVRSILFRGKWISQSTLLKYLLFAWIACGMLGLFLSLRQSRSSLLDSQARLEQLAAINKALELEARELAGQAHTDPLTGALNRQGLREALMDRLGSPAHYGKDLAVIFMDLDHFKHINDQHGHDAGDEVLRRFAAVIRREVRAADKLVRWGGEEFLLVCPETNREHAAMLAEKLRSAMATQDWPHDLRVTCSFGATALITEEDIGSAIARADAALYVAKSNGRNRVEVA